MCGDAGRVAKRKYSFMCSGRSATRFQFPSLAPGGSRACLFLDRQTHFWFLTRPVSGPPDLLVKPSGFCVVVATKTSKAREGACARYRSGDPDR